MIKSLEEIFHEAFIYLMTADLRDRHGYQSYPVITEEAVRVAQCTLYGCY